MALLHDLPLDENLALPESAAGYPTSADVLVAQYESVSFEQAHRTVLHYLTLPPTRVADLGAGSGRDAAALAGRGHDVYAVEPVPQMRDAAQLLHADAGVTWLDDTLPELDTLTLEAEQSGEFGLILASAVWMHLDSAERALGLRRVTRLLSPEGRLVLTLRHGPAPRGRRVHDVAPVEVMIAAADCGLELAHFSHVADALGRRDVSWTNLVLERA
ncbi:MAG: class I SAM-dependent methyltransferase [Streptosporangiales bacterium]|nr:class I SAM-dependent methyltransferase [Streptosporangiales bacterium]